jgi:8-oxo-dGTP diphosphatase
MRQPHRTIQVVAALLRCDENLLLVEQQGPVDPFPTWALPAGVGQPGELLAETLVRELREETGLQVLTIGRLAYLAQRQAPAVSTLAFVFEVELWGGELRSADPEGLVRTACFMPLPQALARLEALPWRAMREPLVAYLRGEVPAGATWLYRSLLDGSDQLVACLGAVL